MKSIVLLFLACATLLSAAPEWTKDVNVTKPGPHLKIRPVQLSYQLSWNGTVNSGRATFRFGVPDKRYPKNFIGQVFGNSSGVARNIFPFDFNYTSFLKKSDYRPQVFVAEETDREETKNTTTRFSKKGISVTQKETKRKTGSSSNSTSSFAYPNAFCLHSAILYVRSLDLKPGQEAVFVVMPFKTPYLARVKNLGNEIHRSRRTIKLDLKLQKIDRSTLALKSYDKMKSFTLWLSDDPERLPLEFRTKVFIGDVRAVLDSKTYL